MRQLIPIWYKEEVFPMMLEDARERAKNNPDSDYETKRVAYWRQQNFNLKKIQMTHQERLQIQEGLLSRCNKILVEKFDAIQIGLPDAYFERADGLLKDLAIELLQTIPHEDEEFCLMPDIKLSNCKPLGDFETIKPMSAVELAELVKSMKNDVDKTNWGNNLGLT